MKWDRMLNFSLSAGDHWIEGFFAFSTRGYLTPTTCHVSNIVPLASTTDTHTEKWDPRQIWSWSHLSLFEKQTFSPNHDGLMRRAELHHDRGNILTPCAAQEAFFLPLCCYFSQPTSKVRTPKARVVRALCLLSMCVITSFKSWGPSHELECLSADSFKEQRARDGRHVLDS